MSASSGEVVEIAERYYDSDDADRFYLHVWGGEDIHIGLYERPSESIADASLRTVETLADRIADLGPQSRVLDLGAGYGGAARYLAKRFGCQVACLNLSETQNARNRELSDAAGLGQRIRVVHGNFERVPEPDSSFDVVWSQDAFLHSGQRLEVLQQARRVLKPGGQLIFTDPMQADDVPSGVLAPVLARIHLDSMGSFGFYREAARSLGMEEVETTDLTHQLVRHYTRVREELSSRRQALSDLVSPDYIERMLGGLGHWIDAGSAGHLAWGILRFRVPV